MTTLNKIFSFLSTIEGFTGYPENTDIVMSYDSGYGNPSGSLKTRIFGRNKAGESYWEWSGTWEDLGVPSGDVITQVRVNNADNQCTEWNVVDACTIGPYSIYDSLGTTLIATLWPGRSPTGVEGSWTQIGNQTYQSIASTYEASNTSIKIRIYNTLDLANNANAALTVYDDTISLDIEYGAGADVLIANSITTTLVVEVPSIGQIHELTSVGIVTNLIVESPLLEIVVPTDDLIADGVTTNPVVDVSTIGQIHDLDGVDISADPVAESSSIGQIHELISVDIDVNPVVEASVIEQTHILDAVGIITTPVVESPVLVSGSIEDQCAVIFNGLTTQLNAGSDSSLDDLPSADVTFECVVYPNTKGEGLVTSLFYKLDGLNNGWWLHSFNNKLKIRSYLGGVVTQTYEVGALFTQNAWHHIAFTYTLSLEQWRIFIDGVEVVYNLQETAIVGTDASKDLFLGVREDGYNTLDGKYAWARISDVIRYTGNYTPPEYDAPPSLDVNTIEQWNLNAGVGTTAEAEVITPTNDGLITNGSWVCSNVDVLDAIGITVNPVVGAPTLAVPEDQYAVIFNGLTTTLNAGSDASLDDLPSADVTFECVVYADTVGEGTATTFFSKHIPSPTNGYWLYAVSGKLYARGYLAGVASATYETGNSLTLDSWHHVAFTYTLSTQQWRIFIDGAEVSYTAQPASAVGSVATADLYLGARYDGAYTTDGKYAWARISDSIRYTGNFTPPEHDSPPVSDINTIEQWNLNDGLGTIAEAEEITPTNDGLITDGSWISLEESLIDDLVATNVITTPVVETSVIAQVHALVGTSISTTLAVETSIIGQTHVLDSIEIVTTPIVETSTIGQTHGLDCVDVSVDPVVESPSIEQIHDLVGVDIVTNSVVETSIITHIHVLDSVEIVTNPVVEISFIGQTQVLTSVGIVTNSVVETSIIGQTHVLAGIGIVTNSVVETPLLEIVVFTDDLIANSITINSVVETPIIGQIHVLDSVDIVTNSAVGTPLLGIITPVNELIANSIITNPVVEIPIVGQTHILDSIGVVTNPLVEDSIITHIHVLDGVGIVTNSVVEIPIITHIHVLSGVDIITYPVTGTTFLDSEGEDNLIPIGIAISSVVGESAIGQIHILSGSSIVTIPVVDTSLIEQIHVLDVVTILVSPILDIPVLGQTHIASAVGITTILEVGESVIGQIHTLSSDEIYTTPVVESTIIGQIHVLDVVTILVSPILDTPVFGQTHIASAVGITTTPEVGIASFVLIEGLAAIIFSTIQPEAIFKAYKPEIIFTTFMEE